MKKIYVDMDGVIADFKTGFKNIYGRDIDSISKKELDEYKKKFYKDNFFLNLPKTESADDLIEFLLSISDVSVEILTAVGDNDTEENAKLKERWVKKYYPSLKFNWVKKAKDKVLFSANNKYLIDDRFEKSLSPFLESGGNGFLFESFNDELKESIISFTEEKK